jgi:hypothetical protein
MLKHLSFMDVIKVDVAFMPHNHLPKVLLVALSGGNLRFSLLSVSFNCSKILKYLSPIIQIAVQKHSF